MHLMRSLPNSYDFRFKWTATAVIGIHPTKDRGCRYEIIEEIKEAVAKVTDMLTQEDFHGAFQKLL